MCGVKSVGQEAGGEGAKCSGCRNAIQTPPSTPKCKLNPWTSVGAGKAGEITGGSGRAAPAQPRCEGERRSDQMGFNLLPKSTPRGPALPSAVRGEGAAPGSSDPMFLIVPTLARTALNHQSLGSDVTQIKDVPLDPH